MSHNTPSTPSSSEAPTLRPQKTKADLLQLLSDDIRSRLGPLEEDAFTEFIASAGVLGRGELRMLTHYAGPTLKTRTGVLDKILFYRREHDNREPIAFADGKWICNICPVPTLPPPDDHKPPVTFQKMAIHLTSHHWGLLSWVCPIETCSRPYKSHDSLKRHHEQRHKNKGRPDAFSAPSPQAETIDAVSSRYQSLIGPRGANPQPAAASGPSHVEQEVDQADEERSLPQRPYRTMPRPPTVDIVESRHSLPTEPLDTNPQPATASRSNYVGNGVGSTNQKWPPFHPRPHRITPGPPTTEHVFRSEYQPIPEVHPAQVASASRPNHGGHVIRSTNQQYPHVNQRPNAMIPPPQAPFVSNQFPLPVSNQFPRNIASNLYYPGLGGPYGPTHTISSYGSNTAQHFHLTGGAQHVPVNEGDFSMTQYLPHSNLSQGNFPSISFDGHDSAHPGPSSSSAPNYSAPSGYPRSYYNPETWRHWQPEWGR